MMIKKKSNPWARLKYLYVLPLAAVAVAAFARPEVSNEFNEISSVKVNDLASIVKTIRAENEDSAPEASSFETINVSDSVKRLDIRIEEGKEPLFIIDGLNFGYLSINDIDASMVESVTVLRGEEATKAYGEKGKDGVVLITSKYPEGTKANKEVIEFTQSAKPSDKKFTVKGVVVEYPSHKPIQGANVLVRGTTNGILTDENGNFNIQVKEGDVLVVLYAGRKTQYLDMKPGITNLGVHMPVENEIIKSETFQNGEVVFLVVEEAPSFPGGNQEAMMFLAKNIKYPEAAVKAKIEGRVIVQFVVGKDGSISDVRVVRGVCPELDAEAVRVVKMMPKWIPGKQRGKEVAVKFTLPIMFRLPNSTSKSELVEKADYYHGISLKVDKEATPEDVAMVKVFLRSKYAGVPFTAVGDKSPLIVVDGKEMGTGYDAMKEIPVDQIKSISVVKSEKDAVAQYGKKAKDGVIMIVTKNNQQ